jgi:VanZ family protein
MFWKYNFYSLFLALVMFILNMYRSQSLPNPDLMGILPFDKFAHFLQFCLLTFLVIVGFAKQKSWKFARYEPIKYGLIICSIFAVFLETWQFIFLKLYFQWTDSLANFLGIIGGILFFIVIYKNISLKIWKQLKD